MSASVSDSLSDPAADRLIAELAHEALAAQRVLATAPTMQKAAALAAAAAIIRARAPEIEAANAEDLATAPGLTGALQDRLRLDPERIAGIAEAVEQVGGLADPVGSILEEWERPNGLKFARVRVPLGLVAIVYESRPNVTVDAGALCLMSGNACLLRGGSEAARSNRLLHACMVQGLAEAGLPEAAISFVPTQDRAAVGAMLRAQGLIDILIPRGGKPLVARVQQEARVPVLAHLDGICHVYLHDAADVEKAHAITLNAKMRRTGICGAAETLLIDRSRRDLAESVVKSLLDAGCEVRVEPELLGLDRRLIPATHADWGTEYLDAIISVKLVDGIHEAIDHIATHGSDHTDSIITEDPLAAEHFLQTVDSAIVLHNASTQFADGGEFGFGAEIGIATGKLHARGPVALEGLTTYKTIVRGSGQVRG